MLRRGISIENLQNLHLQQGCAGNPQTGHSLCWSSFPAKHNISWQICFLRDSYVCALADAPADIAHRSAHIDQIATWEVQIQGFQEAKLRRTQFQKPASLTFEGRRGSSGENKQEQKPPEPKTRTKPENIQNLKSKCRVQLCFFSI